MTDFYALLRVSRSASKGEIKAAYRLLALKYHPDVHKNQNDGGQMFRQLTEAYQILADDNKRRSYDMTLGVRHVRTPRGRTSYYNQYNARTKKKPGPISREEHKFDYDTWKAWHYGDNAYIQSNIKQNKKGWMNMEGNSGHQQFYQRQMNKRRDDAAWRDIRNKREQVLERVQQRRENRQAAQEEQSGLCTIS